jgi:hypothetical protein
MDPSLYGGVINRMLPRSKKISLDDCDQIGKDAVPIVEKLQPKDAEERAWLMALVFFRLKSNMFWSLP